MRPEWMAVVPLEQIDFSKITEEEVEKWNLRDEAAVKSFGRIATSCSSAALEKARQNIVEEVARVTGTEVVEVGVDIRAKANELAVERLAKLRASKNHTRVSY